MAKKKIFYHEDFYRQIELIPEENYFSASRFITELPPTETSEHGIYNLTTRPEQKVTLLDRNISIVGIKNILDPIGLLYSEDVETGYGRTTLKDENTLVWGFERYGIFVKQNKGYAEALWLCNSSLFSPDNTPKFLSLALFSLMEYYSLVLIDWNKELICRAASEQNIKEYLAQNLAFTY